MIVSLFFLAYFSFTSAGLLGGFQELPVDSDRAKDTAHRCIEHLNEMTNSMYYSVLIRVVEAKSQVVNGINYQLKFYLAPTICNKDEVDAKDVKDKCPISKEELAQLCEVKYYERPWANVSDLKEFSCSHVPLSEALKV